MTPRERANRITGLTEWIGPEAVRRQVEMEIENALVEEREACARLMDKRVESFQVLIDHAPTPIRAEDLKRVKHSLEIVAKQIRARSESYRKEID